jgi:hypothetical protein
MNNNDDDDLIWRIKLLPNLVQNKIIYLYILNFLKHKRQLKALQIINNINGFKDFNSKCLFFDKFNSVGFIEINELFLKYIFKKKWPHVILNSLININFFRTMIQKVWRQVKFHYQKLKILPGKPENHNIYIAGGFFTNYINENLISKEFKDYFHYFQRNKDIDLYYTNKNQLSKSEYDCYYLKIKEYFHQFNLVHCPDDFSMSVIDAFDYNFCNIIFFTAKFTLTI